MEKLYAVGETACNGVHGRNRLASNSLLESMIFAKRAARDIAKNYIKEEKTEIEDFDFKPYKDIVNWNKENKKLIKDEIAREDEIQRNK